MSRPSLVSPNLLLYLISLCVCNPHPHVSESDIRAGFFLTLFISLLCRYQNLKSITSSSSNTSLSACHAATAAAAAAQ